MLRGVVAVVVAVAVVAGGAGAVPVAGGNGRLLVVDGGQIFTVALDGARTQLTFDGGNGVPIFSPDGRRVAFGKGSITPLISLALVDAERVFPERTVHAHTEAAPHAGIQEIRWAPDARRLAYSVGGRGLYLVDVDSGAAPVRIAEPPSGLDWSPDGEALAYSVGGDVFVHRIGGAATRVVDGPTDDVAPRFSPDGTRIAFLRRPTGGIFAIGRDGRNGVFLGAAPAGLASPPAWSPDGRFVVFSGTERVEPPEGRTPQRSVTAVWVASADGSGTTLVRRHARALRFSPDGSRVLLEARYDTWPGYEVLRPGVFVMNADGSCMTYVTTGLAADWQPLPGAPPHAPARCVDLVVETTTPTATELRGFPQTISLTNAGNEPARDVVLSQTFDGDVRAFRWVTGEARCAAARTRFECRWETIPPNTVVAVSALVRPVVPGRIDSTIAVASTADDSDPTSNSVATSTRVSPCWLIAAQNGTVFSGTSAGERLCGERGPDVFDGRGGDDVLLGQFGDDVLRGGPGRDQLVGGYGNDTIDAQDGARDSVDCGRGTDVAAVDRLDRVRRCERVRRG